MTQEDIIALFPLPNVVFFPGTNLPLHIFEPRYVEMVKDTLHNKQLIGMFLLQPGWETEYYGNPPVFPVGCAGELIHVEELPEGKYNIVLRGLYRARAIESVQELPYRKIRVEAMPDQFSEDQIRIHELQQKLLDNYRKFLQRRSPDDLIVLDRLTDFTEIVNTIASSLELEISVKQQLLEENDVGLRAEALHQILKKQVSLFEWTDRFAHLRPSDPNRN